MTDVTLVLCPPWSAEVPPIGLAYLKRYLEAHGKSVTALDLNLLFFRRSGPEERDLYRFGSASLIDLDFFEDYRRRHAATFQNSLEQILEADSPIVGFSLNSYNKLIVLDLVRALKRRRPETRIVLGGFALSVNPGHDPSLRYGVAIDGGLTRGFHGIDDGQYPYFEDVDYVGIGEGEVLLDRLVDALLEGKTDPASVPGVLAYPFSNPAPYRVPPLETDLNRIPFPTYEGIDVHAYDKKVIPLIFSRGCICRCAFCTDPIVWRKYRYRSGWHILSELRHHIERHGITDFMANDQIINGHLPQLTDICEQLVASGFGQRITWGGNAVVRADQPLDSFAKLYESGCRWLTYGVESGSDKVLARMNKMFRSRTAEAVLRATHEAGIRVTINVIVGFPGEGEAEFGETMAFLERVGPHVDEISNLNPLIVTPRTSLETKPQRYDIALEGHDHWKDWTMNDGSNGLAERMARVRRVRAWAEANGKPVGFVNELA